MTGENYVARLLANETQWKKQCSKNFVLNDFTEQGFLERMYLTRFYNQPFAANDKQSLSGIVSLCCYV